MLDPRRDVQHLAFAHGDLLAADQELERALQDVGHLLALVRVHRHQAAALQIDLREHLALAGHHLARQHFGDFFEGDLVPAMQTNRLAAHGSRAYTNRAGCYNSRRNEGRSQRARRTARSLVDGLRRAIARLLARLSLHAAVAQAGRQGNPAQRPEPDLLPDQRRRPRGGARRRPA